MGKKITWKLFDFFLFSSLFMAVCASVMVYQTYELLLKQKPDLHFTAFVFFSTICSYNFHWMLTPSTASGSEHNVWSLQHRILHFVLSMAGLAVGIYFFFILQKFWLYLVPAAVLTFIYSAPKIPLSPFRWLKKMAIGKTIFLAMMWVYVTVSLPLLIEEAIWTREIILFTVAQFFFIFSICILFDYRDREHDKAEHIISLITYLSERGIDRLYYFSILIYSIVCLYLWLLGLSFINIILLLIPIPVLAGIYRFAKKNFNDYLYYFLLDGLLMLPGLLLWIMNRF